MNDAKQTAKFLNMIGQTVVSLINSSKIFKEWIVLDKVVTKDRTVTISWK